MSNLSGIGVSPGVVVGPIRRVIQTHATELVPATPRHVFDALEKVALDLEHSAMTIDLEVAKEVLSAQAMMARDPALVEAIGGGNRK